MEGTCLLIPGMASRRVSLPTDVQVNTAACISVEHTGWGSKSPTSLIRGRGYICQRGFCLEIKTCSRAKQRPVISSLHGLAGRDCGKKTAFEWVGCVPSLCIGAGLGCKAGVALTSELNSGGREARKRTHGPHCQTHCGERWGLGRRVWRGPG